jgi:hypothetical protein
MATKHSTMSATIAVKAATDTWCRKTMNILDPVLPINADPTQRKHSTWALKRSAN